MNAPTPTKRNGNGNGIATGTKIAWALVGFGIFLGGVIAGVVGSLKTDPQSRPLAYTSEDHAVYAESEDEKHRAYVEHERQKDLATSRLLDARLANLTVQIDRLVVAMDKHAGLPMHAGAALTFARIQGDLEYLRKKVDEIDKKVQ